jgi:hypothetical protein
MVNTVVHSDQVHTMVNKTKSYLGCGNFGGTIEPGIVYGIHDNSKKIGVVTLKIQIIR